MNYENLPRKKCWSVIDDTLDGAYDRHYGSVDIFTNTSGEAKSAYLKGCYGEGKYTDIKARRVPQNDLYEFEGKFLSQSDIEAKLRQRERNQKILDLPEDKLYYVQNGYSGNNLILWGLDSCGYTSKVNQAQKYTKAEILTFINGREQDVIWPADEIDNNLVSVVDSQNLNHKLKI